LDTIGEHDKMKKAIFIVGIVVLLITAVLINAAPQDCDGRLTLDEILELTKEDTKKKTYKIKPASCEMCEYKDGKEEKCKDIGNKIKQIRRIS